MENKHESLPGPREGATNGDAATAPASEGDQFWREHTGFSVAEWHRLIYTRWLYRRGLLTERP